VNTPSPVVTVPGRALVRPGLLRKIPVAGPVSVTVMVSMSPLVRLVRVTCPVITSTTVPEMFSSRSSMVTWIGSMPIR
jgi:hypothetical protein